MPKSLIYISIILTGIFLSCTEIIKDYQSPAAQSILTFEGGISNQKGPHSISLFRTSSEIENFTVKSPISGAKIYITDEKNVRIDFKEIDLGFYQTDANVQGKEGGVYKLFMEIDGKKFESTPETMPQTVPIDAIYSEASVKESVAKTDNFRTGYDIFVDFKDAPKEGQYYRWTWKNYAKVRYCSQCKVQWDNVTNSCDERNASRFAMRINHICRGNCWDIKYSDNFNIFSDGLSNGREVKRIFVTRVPNLIDEYHLPFDKYFYEVEQRSLTKNAYFHYKVLQDQAEKSGTFFDVPALTTFNLNIKPVDGNTEKILGVFEVFASSTKIITVKVGDLIKNEEPRYNKLLQALDCMPNPCTAPCLEGLYRTKTRPNGWVD